MILFINSHQNLTSINQKTLIQFCRYLDNLPSNSRHDSHFPTRQNTTLGTNNRLVIIQRHLDHFN